MIKATADRFDTEFKFLREDLEAATQRVRDLAAASGLADTHEFRQAITVLKEMGGHLEKLEAQVIRAIHAEE